ncbi:MAG: NAD-dependent epimerase/dehydratase family protein, partial [Candidatus Zixiibacteriota bacterium]
RCHDLDELKRLLDLGSGEDMSTLVDGIEAVIHTAAWVNFRKDQFERFHKINTEGALRLFKAAQKAGVRRFVHVSTVAAVGAVRRDENGTDRIGRSRATEDSKFNLDHVRIPYIQTKYAAETRLIAQASDGDTELVIVNPSIIVAPSRTNDDRRKARRLFARLMLPDFPNRLNLVDIRDVAPAILVALKRGRPNHRYILSGDDITARELVLEVSAITGQMPHLVRVPRPLCNMAARAGLLAGKLFGRGKVSFYPELVKLLDYDWAFSSTKARNEFRYQHRSLHITLENLLTNNFVGTWLRPEL